MRTINTCVRGSGGAANAFERIGTTGIGTETVDLTGLYDGNLHVAAECFQVAIPVSVRSGQIRVGGAE